MHTVDSEDGLQPDLGVFNKYAFFVPFKEVIFMALFGKSLYPDTRARKVVVKFGVGDKQDASTDKTLIEMAKEKFGNDKRLMLEIDLFLSQKRKVHQNPSKLAWASQLSILEKYPENERLKQVIKSIRNDYKSLAYEKKENDDGVKRELAKEEDIRYDVVL